MLDAAAIGKGGGKAEEDQVAAGHEGVGDGAVAIVARALFRGDAGIGQRVAADGGEGVDR
ncbi:hypothetical protein D3C72_2342730 [compost metagenome]